MNSLTFHDEILLPRVKAHDASHYHELVRRILETGAEDHQAVQSLLAAYRSASPVLSDRQLVDFSRCAEFCSERHAALLSSVAVRQRAELLLLNFYLRKNIDEHGDADDLDASTVMDMGKAKPLDVLPIGEDVLVAASGKKGLVIIKNGKEQKIPASRVTQLDAVNDDLISLGSSSFGGIQYLEGGRYKTHRMKDKCLLSFTHNREVYHLFSNGVIRDRRQTLIGQIAACPRVDRARKFGDKLFLLNYCDSHRAFEVSLQSLRCRERRFREVVIVNDLYVKDDFLYCVDKQQGHLFKYRLEKEAECALVWKKFKFADGANGLMEPIAVRKWGDALVVVNHLSGKVNALRTYRAL
jgi:hypothetical protein